MSMQVPYIFLSNDDLHAELVMIDEILARAQLTSAQEAAAIKRQ
jgi:hypothetical protein